MYNSSNTNSKKKSIPNRIDYSTKKNKEVKYFVTKICNMYLYFFQILAWIFKKFWNALADNIRSAMASFTSNWPQEFANCQFPTLWEEEILQFEEMLQRNMLPLVFHQTSTSPRCGQVDFIRGHGQGLGLRGRGVWCGLGGLGIWVPGCVNSRQELSSSVESLEGEHGNSVVYMIWLQLMPA